MLEPNGGRRSSSYVHLEATSVLALLHIVAGVVAGLVVALVAAPIGLLIRNLAAPSLQS